jgi:hypothetical protein
VSGGSALCEEVQLGGTFQQASDAVLAKQLCVYEHVGNAADELELVERVERLVVNRDVVVDVGEGVGGAVRAAACSQAAMTRGSARAAAVKPSITASCRAAIGSTVPLASSATVTACLTLVYV